MLLRTSYLVYLIVESMNFFLGERIKVWQTLMTPVEFIQEGNHASKMMFSFILVVQLMDLLDFFAQCQTFSMLPVLIMRFIILFLCLRSVTR
jgi:hypothetical protein